MNEYDNTSELIQRRAELTDQSLADALQYSKTEDEAINAISRHLKNFFTGVGKPILQSRMPTTGDLPIAEDYNNNCLDITADVATLYNEYTILGDTIADYFNYRQTEKNRLSDRVRYLTGLCSDLSLMANIDSPAAVYFKDTFTNTDKIDKGIPGDSGLRAHVATKEGVVTLGRTQSINRCTNAVAYIVQDGDAADGNNNGTIGNFNVAVSDSGSPRYISDSGSHNDISVVLDGNPDTIFEYQAVNFDDTLKNEVIYDLSWAKLSKSDVLRLKFDVDLQEAYDINWVTINPYNPPKSSGKVVVKSIQTSVDGSRWVPLYDGRLVINSELNTAPQTYRQDDVVVDDYVPSKFAGQGVWSFETRSARYVRVIMQQSDAYDETIGHTYYKRTNPSNNNRTWRIAERDASQAAISGPPGKYMVGAGGEYITKGIELFNGWRFCIGVRDFGVFSYKYAERSEIMTTTMNTLRAIKKVALYVNERIPPSLTNIVRTANEWIRYEISLDGQNWLPISPMHRRPAGNESTRVIRPEEIVGYTGSRATSGKQKTMEQLVTEEHLFPPKIYEVNPRDIPSTRTEIYKGYVYCSTPPTSAKLRIILSRPEELETITPIVEDYSIKVYFEE